MRRLSAAYPEILVRGGSWVQRILIFSASSLLLVGGLNAQGIVDCVSPARISVSRIQGQIFDPTGVGLPGVKISLRAESGSNTYITADQQGRFHIPTSPGQFQFQATLPMFQSAAVELHVGKDAIGLIRPSNLYVILGMIGSFCPWITTSEKEFRNNIRSNKQRLKETSQNNATQK